MAQAAHDELAHHRIDAHEDICAVRYQGIESWQQKFEAKHDTSTAQLHAKIDKRVGGIYKHLWLGILALIGTLITVIGFLLSYVIDKLPLLAQLPTVPGAGP